MPKCRTVPPNNANPAGGAFFLKEKPKNIDIVLIVFVQYL